MATAEQATTALTAIVDSGSGRSALELGWIDRIRVSPPRAVIRLNLPGFAQSQRERIVQESRTRLLEIDGISDVQIEVGSPPPQHSGTQPGGIGHAGHGQVAERQAIPGVRRVIAVSSGKGGVGKSTVAVNLACALARQGLKVGLLDADIYGPNAPTMLGVADQTPQVEGSGSEQRMTPIETCGLAMVSMGLLIDEDQPVIWRGPMLNGIIRQFLYQVNWGERDVLVVDLPPGTGDAQLSLAQAVPMAGVLIVTTPQQVALQDARRGLAMFRQMSIPVLGVIENMSEFIPPDQPERRYALFGEGGGQRLADEFETDLLAKIPLEMPVLSGGDQGRPIVISQPESASAQVFIQLAETVLPLIAQSN
ncbi:sodium:proton antiporter [Synechococcus sp. BS56D]|jgi:ATP-binding protein involved in chromosome partitioning|uniref:Mrp/NBP35 family ATP-binding protein n=1 Tax=Synechococcus sp. BS56D TaxID=2055944 RepID=UPI00103E2919|nr:Mrp/NBP35 family ATP-binding protein [Synechococcus sp. BS56D]TCD56006.1 sodium:proton antiporter [Synechococcus sp. BS56D]